VREIHKFDAILAASSTFRGNGVRLLRRAVRFGFSQEIMPKSTKTTDRFAFFLTGNQFNAK